MGQRFSNTKDPQDSVELAIFSYSFGVDTTNLASCNLTPHTSEIAAPKVKKSSIDHSKFTEPISDGKPSSEYPTLEPGLSGLAALPLELVVKIAASLPPSSMMSLDYSCRRIHHGLGLSIQEVLGPKGQVLQLSNQELQMRFLEEVLRRLDKRLRLYPMSTVSRLPSTMHTWNSYHGERWKLLCMFDRDKSLSSSQALCGGCKSIHESSLFSEQSLVLHSSERLCKGRTGRVWICRHWRFDYKTMITPGQFRGRHKCGRRGPTVADGWKPTVNWPIMRLTKTSPPSPYQVEKALSLLKVHMCRHWCLNDRFVSSLYSEQCKQLRWRGHLQGGRPECQCMPCAEYAQESRKRGIDGKECAQCGTSIHYAINKSIYGGETLNLIVTRNLRAFRSLTDPAWLAQIHDLGDFLELEKAWRVAAARCGRIMRYPL